ncbi:MAG: SPASM domain-containing protein, partial [Promethearchaeota archaeon]
SNIELLDLIKDNFIEVFVSIDGLERSHNDFRNADCFKASIEGIKLLLERGIDVSINTMIHKKNLKEFDDMLKLLNSIGKIKNWSIDIPTFGNTTPQEIINQYSITPEEGGRILKDYGWGVMYESEGEQVNYACGPYLMAVDVTGVVTKCGFFTKRSPGNIFDLGFKKSWDGIQKYCNWSIYDLKCKAQNCEYLEECRGGCRYRAFKRTGEILGVDSFKCVQFGKFK